MEIIFIIRIVPIEQSRLCQFQVSVVLDSRDEPRFADVVGLIVEEITLKKGVTYSQITRIITLQSRNCQLQAMILLL